MQRVTLLPEKFFNNRYGQKVIRTIPGLYNTLQEFNTKIDLSKATNKKVLFFLSFDCDTTKDARVLGKILDALEETQIKAVFAVPGKLLLANKEEYIKAGNAGHEFMNHGHEIHCVLNEETNEYISSFFYHELKDETWKTDILNGHQAVIDALGITPIGFRTPHFGSFQEKDSMTQMYTILKSLNYQYSSSTMPYKSMVYGQVYKAKEGLIELPLTGMLEENPFTLLDSWSLRFCEESIYKEEDYFRIFKDNLMAAINNSQKVQVLNYYVDPSQVYDFDGFYRSLEFLKSQRQYWDNMTYKDLLRKI